MRRWPLLVALLSALLGTGAVAPAAAAPPPSSSSAQSTISVSGNQLLRGGVRWVPRGVQIVGLVAPDPDLKGKYAAAHPHFGASELSAAVNANADLIRFQVSEFGLDPESPLYSPTYLQEVQNAVQTARNLGLAVIVSVQAEAPAGEPVRCSLPDAGVERVWRELAPLYATDRGVMFELYNEPALGATSTAWQEWLNGGVVGERGGSCQAVGMQTLVDDIRSEGADNVIIVPGLAGEQTLAGRPPVADPYDPADPQLAYGIHYPSQVRGVGTWDRRFGDQSAQVPVIVTEWDAPSDGECLPDTPARAQLLLDYLASKQIGIVGFAFDIPGTIIKDWTYAPTDYANFKCGAPGDGPGQLLFGQYSGRARAAGVSAGQGLAWMVSSATITRLGELGPRLSYPLFDTPRTLVIGAGSSGLANRSAPNAVASASFTDERALAQAVRSHRLRSGTRAVLLIDSHAAGTPTDQQLHPARYYAQAAQVAHNHNLLLIAAPDPDVALARHKRASSAQQRASFLRLRIAAAAARSADVLAVQGQSLEARPPDYAAFVTAAAEQAASAHPGIELLSTISTNPGGAKQDPDVMMTDAQEVGSVVSGLWLDDPQRSAQCRQCSGPYPQVALRFLRGLQPSTSS